MLQFRTSYCSWRYFMLEVHLSSMDIPQCTVKIHLNEHICTSEQQCGVRKLLYLKRIINQSIPHVAFQYEREFFWLWYCSYNWKKLYGVEIKWKESAREFSLYMCVHVDSHCLPSSRLCSSDFHYFHSLYSYGMIILASFIPSSFLHILPNSSTLYYLCPQE